MSDLDEARQLNRRYREALERILNADERPWCDMYAECAHEGCKASHDHIEIARGALDVESSWSVLR